ncbi:MAG: 2,3-bisphosphoglycerate-independent phosphoglycerate mutase, partial [Candidatus Binataceae bacterium]
MPRPPIAALIIFDGWGIRAQRENNAIALALTPTMDRLYRTCAWTTLDASGESVGLPPGVMGNSEVGHLTIGAGRVIYQDVMRITKAIETGDFSRNGVLLAAVRAAASNRKTLHVWGLLSDASVHSHIDHLFALLDLAARESVQSVAVHAVLDGRDTPPRSAFKYINQLEEKLRALGHGRIATVTGRYYAMDRDTRWERTERAWQAMVEGEGKQAQSARAAVEVSYAQGKSDEFVEPAIVGDRTPLADGDQVICYNFRADRARQLTAALALAEFSGFARPRVPKIGYACMTEYDRALGLPIAFGPADLKKTLAEVLAQNNITNL